MYWVRTGVVALIACLAVVACDDNPVSEGRGDATSLTVNPDFAVVNAADTTRISAFARDRYGDLTYGQVTFTACDAWLVLVPDETRVEAEPSDRTKVVSGTLGESCATATAGGLERTTTVQVVPRTMGTTIQSVIGSGQSATATVEFFDQNGDPVTGFDTSDLVFSVSNPSVATVDETGTVTGAAPGSASLDVQLDPKWNAIRTSSASFAVDPGAFPGTVTPSTVPGWGDTITVSAAAGTFDDDTEITFDGLLPYVVSFDESSEFVVVGPAGMGSSPSEMLITNAGPDQLAYTATVEVTDPNPNDADEPNNGGGGGGGSLPNTSESVAVTLPFEQWRSVGNLDLDDVLQITLVAAATVQFDVDWNFTDADVDVLIYDGAGSLTSNFGCATGDVPESCTADLGPGTFYVDINMYDAGGHDWVTTLVKIQ